MLLLLFRHGIAEDVGPAGDDASRRLTPRGRRRTAQAAAGLLKVCEKPDAILTSPKARAAQTAAILGEAFDVHPQTAPALARDTDAILALLRGRAEATVMLVGHEPMLSDVAERLCAGADGAGHAFIDLKKAGCICLDVPDLASVGHARLVWVLPPRVLRALADAPPDGEDE